MDEKIGQSGIWYHSSNRKFSLLREGSTITPWKELARAFSHRPSVLEYDGENIRHNGKEQGFLFVIDEPVEMGKDIFPHPRSTMDPGLEFITKRPLKVRLIEETEISPL